jgi:cell division protein ZapA
MGAVEVEVGGKSYRVAASADEPTLRRLAATVDAKLRELGKPGSAANPQALVLAAMALAHELEEERARRVALETRARERLSALLARIDEALAEPQTDENSGARDADESEDFATE